MAVFTIKKDDKLPKLRMALTDSDCNPLDLTGATVVFRMRPAEGGALKTNAAGAVIAPATDGIVEYTWDAADVDTEGTFYAEWRLGYAGGDRTVPTSGYVTIQVLPDLDG